jgi:hypothetical protein
LLNALNPAFSSLNLLSYSSKDVLEGILLLPKITMNWSKQESNKYLLMSNKAVTKSLVSGLLLASVLAMGCMPAAEPSTDSEYKVEEDKTPQVFSYSADALVKARDNIQAGYALAVESLEMLLRQADELLDVTPWSVIDKPVTPPSGDKRDYYSPGAYWWPNPDTEDGLPYIRKDGQINPDYRTNSDRYPFESMVSAVETLALCYFFTNIEDYAQKATEIIRVWFLDPETGMNPNMRYAQGIPGRMTGRELGVIDVHRINAVIDAIGLIEYSDHWSSDDAEQIHAWFGKFLDWLTAPPLVRFFTERQRNNIATKYDIKVASMALFTGRDELATKVLENAKSLRIEHQIDADGSQPMEMARSLSLSYSIMNLEGLFTLAQLGTFVNVDLYHYEADDGASLRRALEFLAPFINPDKRWPLDDIRPAHRSRLLPSLRRGANVYSIERYEEKIHDFSSVDAIINRRIELLDPFLH